MGIRRFLHFERIKLILPAVLLAIFSLTAVIRPLRAEFTDTISYLFYSVLIRMEYAYQWYFLTPIHQAVYGTPFIDIPIFMAILFISGYLLSSAILWVHRANGAIYRRGHDVYYALAASIIVLFAAFYASGADSLWSVVFAAIFGYILVTYVWSCYDKSKSGKIEKKLKSERKLGSRPVGAKKMANR